MNVWEKFYQRDDVKKRTLKPEDEGFSFEILDGTPSDADAQERRERFDNLADEAYGESIEELILGVLAFNTSYTMKPNETFKKLRDRAQVALDNGLDPQIPQDEGSSLWEDMY